MDFEPLLVQTPWAIRGFKYSQNNNAFICSPSSTLALRPNKIFFSCCSTTKLLNLAVNHPNQHPNFSTIFEVCTTGCRQNLAQNPDTTFTFISISQQFPKAIELHTLWSCHWVSFSRHKPMNPTCSCSKNPPQNPVFFPLTS